MLRLLLLRHAKAAPHDPAHDHGRGLVGRGRDDAKRMGKFIAREKRRAKETAQIVLAELPIKVPVSVEPRFYEATTAGFIEALRDLPEAAKTVLVVGHNPSLAEAAHLLADGGDKDAMRRMATKFSTCSLAAIDFDLAHWAEISAASGRLVAFVTPASLDGAD
jgi:phosphohistidine phosphatase